MGRTYIKASRRFFKAELQQRDAHVRWVDPHTSKVFSRKVSKKEKELLYGGWCEIDWRLTDGDKAKIKEFREDIDTINTEDTENSDDTDGQDDFDNLSVSPQRENLDEEQEPKNESIFTTTFPSWLQFS